MKILHKKIIIFVVVLAVFISAFSISAFAFSDRDYVLKEVLDVDSFNTTSGTYSDLIFECGGFVFYGIRINYRGYWVIDYFTNEDCTDFITVYDSSSGWTNEVYRTLEFQKHPSDESLINFLDINEFVDETPDSWYHELYEIISSTIFGDNDIPHEATFSLSLVSLILSLFVVLLPVLFALGIFIFVLKRV